MTITTQDTSLNGVNLLGGDQPELTFNAAAKNEFLWRINASKQKILVSILISSERTVGMVVKIWIFAGPLTQLVTAANHI